MTIRYWPARRWVAAALAGIATTLIIGIPTVLIPNPVFGRSVPVQWWSYPVLAVTAVLSGLIFGTYVRTSAEPTRRQTLSASAAGCSRCSRWAARPATRSRSSCSACPGH